MERKEAIEVIKKNWPDSNFTMLREALETLIPELKESEDERIRKIISDILLIDSDEIREILDTNNVLIQDVYAWLEKQGEHANFRNKIQIGDKVTKNRDGVLVNLSQLNRVAKPADKVEPKFKVGDFIANDYCFGKVVALTDDAYLLDSGQGIPFSCEHNAHLWTIQDAKDGDVLATEDWVFIFKKISSNGKPVCHCHYDIDLGFRIDTNSYMATGSEIYPATKEQRDLLFQKMREAGYEWDAEKKELKKVEKKPTEWSEEDDKMLKHIIKDFREFRDCETDEELISDYDDEINWLKSLRPQNNNKWNNVSVTPKFPCNILFRYPNGNMFIFRYLEGGKKNDATTPMFSSLEAGEWIYLDDVKPQNRWKPSDEQINELGKHCPDNTILTSLYEQLKKLRKE